MTPRILGVLVVRLAWHRPVSFFIIVVFLSFTLEDSAGTAYQYHRQSFHTEMLAKFASHGVGLPILILVGNIRRFRTVSRYVSA